MGDHPRSSVTPARRLDLLVALALLVVGAPASAQVIAPTAPPTAGVVRAARLATIHSWGYQLQRVEIARMQQSPFDLVVVDYSNIGSEAGRFTNEDIQRLKQKPDGGRRVVLAYMSIGEAEDYRYYWRSDWVEAINIPDDASPIRPAQPRAPVSRADQGTIRLRPLRLPKLSAPSWLGRENEGWNGNFLVRYWDPGWQSIFVTGQQSYLSRILAAGFDGVYLDRVDAFQTIVAERPQARAEMTRFVIDIAAHARRAAPDFLVVPQNGEQLLADPAYLAAIDAVAKEDLLYGEAEEGQPNPASSISRSMRWLAPATNRGLPVLVVEYLQDKPVVDRLRADIESRGFLPYFGVRALDRLVLPGDFGALSAPPAGPPSARSAAPAPPERARVVRRPQGPATR